MFEVTEVFDIMGVGRGVYARKIPLMDFWKIVKI
jgi:hypothetical protein